MHFNLTTMQWHKKYNIQVKDNNFKIYIVIKPALIGTFGHLGAAGTKKKSVEMRVITESDGNSQWVYH